MLKTIIQSDIEVALNELAIFTYHKILSVRYSSVGQQQDCMFLCMYLCSMFQYFGKRIITLHSGYVLTELIKFQEKHSCGLHTYQFDSTYFFYTRFRPLYPKQGWRMSL